MLDKIRKLRRIEFTFTDDKIHPECHCEYHDVIEEDGLELMRKTHREVCGTETAKTLLNSAILYEAQKEN